MSKTNCKNCGAALDIWAPKCEFCGTKNVNLTALDLDSGEPVNFIFKMPGNIRVVDSKGEDIYFTTLAIPSLETMTMRNDTVNIYGGWGDRALSYVRDTSLEMDLKLTAVHNPQKNDVLCAIQVGGN